MKGAKPPRPKRNATVTLKAVAQHLGLTPGTVSAVLNNSKAARSIPEKTHKRIVAASRGVEGIITIDTSVDEEPSLPTVAVAGHQKVENVTNIVLDHRRAAELGLRHLKELGHERIAFLRGQPKSSDSSRRWEAIQEVARKFEIQIRPELVLQLEGMESTPELGYPYGKALIARTVPFTALFAYNDISAIGAMRAFQEAGRHIPGDISVVGFDDISIASFSIPALTTVRQPLQKMGRIAAKTLLDRIEEGAGVVPEIAVEPELIVRKSTGPPRKL